MPGASCFVSKVFLQVEEKFASVNHKMAINLNELPELVLLNIFSYLSIRQKNRLKLVSKGLKNLVERFPQTKLIIYQSVYPSSEMTKPGDSIELKKVPKSFYWNPPLSVVDFDLGNKFFSNIKCLYLKDIFMEKEENKRSFFENLNCLSGVLVIKRGGEMRLGTIMFDFPLLKILRLEFQQFKNIKLNTPSLEELRISEIATSNEGKVALTHCEYPESLRLFRCVEFKSKLEFPNLETLVCQKLDSDFDLSKFPKLKKLEVYPVVEGKLCLKSSYYRMLSEKRSLAGNRNLEIRLFGFKEEVFTKSEINLEIKDGFDFYFNFEDGYGQLLAKNYAQLASRMPYKVSVLFSSITKYFPGQLPDDFFAKFPSINLIHLDPSSDCSRLIPFLRNAKSVTDLRIDKSLSSEFYDKLATTTVASLMLYQPTESLSFLTRMNNLRSLKIYRVKKSVIGSIPKLFETMFKRENFGCLLISKEPRSFWITTERSFFIENHKSYGFLFWIQPIIKPREVHQSATNLDELLEIVKSKEETLNIVLV